MGGGGEVWVCRIHVCNSLTLHPLWILQDFYCNRTDFPSYIIYQHYNHVKWKLIKESNMPQPALERNRYLQSISLISCPPAWPFAILLPEFTSESLSLIRLPLMVTGYLLVNSRSSNWSTDWRYSLCLPSKVLPTTTLTSSTR